MKYEQLRDVLATLNRISEGELRLRNRDDTIEVREHTEESSNYGVSLAQVEGGAITLGMDTLLKIAHLAPAEQADRPEQPADTIDGRPCEPEAK